MFSVRNLIEAKATGVREETSYPGIGLFWGTEMPRNMKTDLSLMNIVRFLLANYFHTSNPSECFCAHRARATNSVWMRTGRLPRQNDTWVKCWRMHKSQAGWRYFFLGMGSRIGKTSEETWMNMCKRQDMQLTSLFLYVPQIRLSNPTQWYFKLEADINRFKL